MLTHVVAFMILCKLASMQSISQMPASTLSPTSRTTSSTISATTPAVPNPSQSYLDQQNWITREVHYSEYLEEGMNPAAASYVVDNLYRTNAEGIYPERVNDNVIFPEIGGRLPAGLVRGVDELARLSVEGYLMSDARDQEFESSFLSVFYDLQSITADPAESSRLHALVDAQPPPTSKSANRAEAQLRAQEPAETIIGALFAFIFAVLGIF